MSKVIFLLSADTQEQTPRWGGFTFTADVVAPKVCFVFTADCINGVIITNYNKRIQRPSMVITL